MLFKKIMTEVNETDGSEEEFVAIVWEEQKPYNSPIWRVRYEATTVENVTIEQLIEAVCNELENENHHSEMDLPAKIVEHIKKVAGEDVARQVLYNMIDQEGFMLGL